MIFSTGNYHLFALLAVGISSGSAQLSAPEPTAATCTSGGTSTLVRTLSRLPTPPYWPQCSFDGTQSIYTATSTVSEAIDCHGCTALKVRDEPVVHCPAMIITATTHVATPLTVYRTVCSTTSIY